MALTNSNITLHGNPVEILGESLKVGDKCPEFQLTTQDLSDIRNSDFKDSIILLSVIPSVDTPTCQVQTKTLDEKFNSLGDKFKLLTVSRDLPFALSRFCGAEKLNNINIASDYKYRTFGKAFGAEMANTALLTRALFVIDTAGIVRHVEYVSEVSAEPDYSTALDVIKSI